MRFGLVHVDYETQERTVRKSGKWYGDFARGFPKGCACLHNAVWAIIAFPAILVENYLSEYAAKVAMKGARSDQAGRRVKDYFEKAPRNAS